MTSNLSGKSMNFKKAETILLYFLLYSVSILYLYQFLKTANKPRFLEQDEIFYYVEAKGVSLHNRYQTPISYDGYTSIIGDFGAHGVAYPIKDGWLSKIFFQAQDPPMVWNNFFTLILAILLLILFKPFSLTIRLKIALVILTHYIVFSLTFTYMQDIIHILLTVLALRTLYHLYQQEKPSESKYLYYYLVIIIIGILFRYSWFIWGLGLLPLATDFKSFIKWGVLVCILTIFGLLSFRYLVAPWPYIAGNFIANPKNNLSFLDSVTIFRHTVTQNIQLFLTPDKSFISTCMRYLFLILLFVSAGFAIVKRKKIMIAYTLIAWAYFFAAMQFAFLTNGNDLRLLASMNLLFSFALIGTCNSFIFYPIIAVHLFLLPNIVKTVNQPSPSTYNGSAAELAERDASYAKIKDIVMDTEGDNDIAIIVPIQFVYFANNFFVNFPLITASGKQIHYTIMIGGKGYSESHPPNYRFNSVPLNEANYKLVYSDKWMYLYEVIDNKSL